MELHDHLYALGLQTGRELFDDPDRLRAALGSAAASPADVDVVVDAVRRGSYRELLASLDAGTDPRRALDEVGARLAQQRGGDPAAAPWALAVLGFAVGRVGENDVRRYRGATPTHPHPQAHPQAYPQARAQPYAAAYAPPPPAGPGYGSSATGPRKSRTPLLLAVAGTLAAVVLAVVLALVLAGGDGDDTAADDATSATTSETTSETTEPTTQPTTEPTTESVAPAGGVSDEAAAGYNAALLTFADDFTAANKTLGKANNRDDTDLALRAARQMRIAVYDLDLAVRDLDLTPVQPDVNDFLTVSGEMIAELDQLYADAESVLEVNSGIVALPTTDYTDAFTRVQTEINESRTGG